MWYFYLLESLKDQSFYKGHTNDLKRRLLLEHNHKRGGRYTKKHAPYKLVYYEAYTEKVDATNSEKFFKTGYGREVLRGKLENYLKSRNR